MVSSRGRKSGFWYCSVNNFNDFHTMQRELQKAGQVHLPSTYSAATFPSSAFSLSSDSSEEEYFRCTVIPMGLLSEADGMWITPGIAFLCIPNNN